MPEGDSIHRAAQRLLVLVGRRVQASSPHPRGLLTGVAAAVDGRMLESVDPVGKHLLLRFEGGVVVRSHLRMNGRWTVGRSGTRRAGRPWLVLRAGELEAAQWNGPVLTLDVTPARRVGPDILADGVEPEALVRRVRQAHPGRLLGEVLLDQRLVAGLGNMWLAESLWSARVSPSLALGRASDEELEAVLAWARREMRAAVTGSRPGRAVYRRAGRPCPRCGAPIRSAGLGENNRTAYWCAGCQRGD
jgi:endonuclease-8